MSAVPQGNPQFFLFYFYEYAKKSTGPLDFLITKLAGPGYSPVGTGSKIDPMECHTISVLKCTIHVLIARIKCPPAPSDVIVAQGLILLPVPTGEFPGGPASLVMRRSGEPVDYWDIQKV